jgi:hypothetical protein
VIELSQLPPYTFSYPFFTIASDPQLAPLAFHGGPTRTHALLATSPAVDHGNHLQLAVTYDAIEPGTEVKRRRQPRPFLLLFYGQTLRLFGLLPLLPLQR